MKINTFLLNPIRASLTASGEPIKVLQAVRTINGPVFTVEYADGRWGSAKWAEFSVYAPDGGRFADLILDNVC